MTSEFFVHYVNHERAPHYEALGWRIVGGGQGLGAHAYWSCLMRWDGEGPPPEPEREGK